MKLLLKLFIVLIIALIISYFVPYSTTHQTTIKASFFDVANEVNTADNWKNWYTPIKDSYTNNSSQYSIKQDYKNHFFIINNQNTLYQVNSHSPGSLDLVTGKVFKTTQSLRFFFDKDGKVLIEETQTTSLLNHLFNLFNPKAEYNSILNSLKPFMEDSALYYGFDIKRTAVPDTAYITYSQTVLKKDRFKLIDSAYRLLEKFAAKNKVKVMGKPYLNYSTNNGDSVRIITMLVINKPLIIDYESPIIFFTMPKNGNMLVTHYHGEYGKSVSAYSAMEKYVTDNNLGRVYQPFERFTNGKVPNSEKSIVDMDVFFPIY